MILFDELVYRHFSCVKLLDCSLETTENCLWRSCIKSFEAPLTGRRIQVFSDESTSSGVNWEYVDDEDEKCEDCTAFPCFDCYLDGKEFDDERA